MATKRGKRKNSARVAKRVVGAGKRRVNRARRRKNPVKIAATMTGKSTGWMPAKAVRVRVFKGRRVVDVKK